jgi:pilus assembly protein CpaC
MRGARGPAKLAALVVYIIVILVATPQAQQSASFSGSAGSISPGPAAAAPDATTIELLVGRSTILNVGSTIARVSLTVPDIADALVTTPQQLLIHGKQPGTISLFVWDKAGGIKTYEVSVHRDLKELAEHMKQLFPGEPITVAGSGKDVVLSGTVSSKYVLDKASDLASGYVDKKENVVNLLKQQEGVASNQVMLRVRFAEVSRSAVQELGSTFFTGPTGYKNVIARTTTEQFPAPNFSELSRTSDLDNHLTGSSGKYTLSDFLNLFIFSNKYNVGTVIRALQTKGLFQSLAEPNLIALNGKEASFLAGGEYPYPVVQPSTTGSSVTIMFKEFGVRLNFTPTVLGNGLIDLKLRPEVSTLDFSNAITLDGFRLPALSTRRTETEVELQDGQTFAVAGLLNNTVNTSMQKIPGIGDIPILGYLFKSRAYQKNQTELVVMVTPTIVKTGSTGVSEGLPSPVEPYLGKPDKGYQNPAPYTGSPRYPASTNKPAGSGASPAPAPASSAPMTSSPAPAASAPPSQPGVTYVPAPGSAAAPATLAPATPPAASGAPRAAASSASAPRKMTKEEKKAADVAAKQQTEEEKARARAEEWKRAAEERQKMDDARKQAEADREAARKAGEDHTRQQKLDQERVKREAEVAKKNAEIDRKKAEEQKKREKALSDAAERLRQAQAAYEAELQKTGSKGGANDKSKGQQDKK